LICGDRIKPLVAYSNFTTLSQEGGGPKEADAKSNATNFFISE
jgi:hypothetical protein